MFHTDEEIKKVAKSLTHYIYRNTALEDYHASNVKMDNEFHKKIRNIVYRKVKNVCLMHRYVTAYRGKLENKDDLDKILQTVPDTLQLKFIRYLQELIWGFNFGTQWEEAMLAPSKTEKQSLVSYILSGRFDECCRNGCFLNDNTMCDINKDVHNRIYTLLVNGDFEAV